MRARTIAFVIAVLAGCGASRALIEKPIADQCTSTGLKGCAELTEGVLLYIEGDQQHAVQKLHLAVNANEPQEVLAFADGLKIVSQFPGVGQYTAPIMQVVNILASEAKQAEGSTKPRAVLASRKRTNAKPPAQDDTDAPEADDAQAERRTASDSPSKTRGPVVGAGTAGPAWHPAPSDFDGKTVVPALDASNHACALTGFMAPAGDGSRGYCVRVSRGPLVITDLHSSGACPAELFALAASPGDLSAPRWAVYAQPSSAINIGGGALVVRDTEHFVIGTMATADQKMKRDIRCSITWSGWRPTAPLPEQL